MPRPTLTPFSFKARHCILVFCLSTLSAALAAGPDNRYCGGAVRTTTPDDLANVVGDQTLEHFTRQPASMLTCSKGYLLEKCGDHESANLIFDKCIAAGYAGAMIWKALLLEDGSGVERDLPRAAALLHRAATSGDPAYGPIGKMHYATMLYLGKGVARNEAEAMKWFQAAAAEGNEEAQAFLETGYHTGYRDQSGMGAGTPTPQALAAGRWERKAGPREAAERAQPEAPTSGRQATPRKLENSGAATPPPPSAVQPATAPGATAVAGEISGRKLHALAPSPPPAASAGLGLLLVASFVAGLIYQARRRAPRTLVSLSRARSTA